MSASSSPLVCATCNSEIDIRGRPAGDQVFCPGCGQSLFVPGGSTGDIIDLPDPVQETAGYNPAGVLFAADDSKTCPYCGKQIKAAARKCRHCRKYLPGHHADEGGSTYGVWRQGNRLVMDREAVLPAVCVKSNEPTELRLRRRLQWYHPALLLLLPLGLIVFLIVVAVTMKRATIEVPLCEACSRRRLWRLAGAWLWGLAGLGLIGARVYIAGSVPNPPGVWIAVLCLGGLLVMIAAAIVGERISRVLIPARMTDETIWLKGVRPDLLATLQPYPGSD